MDQKYFIKMKSPVGELYLISNQKSLAEIVFDHEWASFRQNNKNLIEKKIEILKEAKKQLEEYFSLKRKKFALDIEFAGTDFQKKVWCELQKIPYGHHISYQEQAQNIGKPNAVRAVGSANGKNPIPIVVPCHRVIGKSGKLTGYSGGLDIKSYLLALESGEEISLSKV